MMQYKDIILHGASLFRQLKAGHPNGSRASISIAAASSGVRRALERRADAGEGTDDFLSSLMGVGGGDESAGGTDIFSLLGGLGGGDGGSDESSSNNDDLLSSLGGGVTEYLEECSIDAGDMMNKALGAYFMYGSGIDLDALTNMNSFDASVLPSLEDVAPVLLAFKDDDEQDCTDEDMVQMTSASEIYLMCSGVASEVLNMKTTDLELELQGALQDVEDACKSVFETLISSGGDMPDEFFDEDSDIGKPTKACLESVLGDNLIGNLIRYEYQSLDKVLGCTKTYSEELPRCVLSAPLEGGTTIALPFSLYKKLCCLIGARSDVAIEGVCTGLYEMLDSCLPAMGADADLLDGAFLGIDVSTVTGDEIPPYCSKFYEDNGMDGAGLTLRFDYYNAHREHGWTVESSSSSPPALPPGEAKTTPVVHLAASDVPAAESSIWEDGEAPPRAESNIAFLIGGVVGFAILALAAVAFYVRPKKTKSPEYAFVSKAFNII